MQPLRELFGVLFTRKFLQEFSVAVWADFGHADTRSNLLLLQRSDDGSNFTNGCLIRNANVQNLGSCDSADHITMDDAVSIVVQIAQAVEQLLIN